MAVEILLIFSIIIFSIVFHEYAHGLVAYKLGDNTPKASGRLTINPIKHIDMAGTIILPILLIIITHGKFVIGYAKPVPINPNHFKNPKRDIMWVGLAGPLSNLLSAIILFILLRSGVKGIIENAVQYGIVINLIFFIFNLIPIPPLDGSRIISALLPYKSAYKYLKLETAGIITIIMLLISGMINWFITPILRALLDVIGLNNIVV